MKYCNNMGECDEDYCGCDAFVKYHEELRKAERVENFYWWLAIGAVGGYFIIRSLITLIWGV